MLRQGDPGSSCSRVQSATLDRWDGARKGEASSGSLAVASDTARETGEGTYSISVDKAGD